MSICPSSEWKTAWAINNKLATHILYGSRSACIDPEVKRSRSQGYKTVTVARLLVTCAATAVCCCCCRRGSACRYDCLRLLLCLWWFLMLAFSFPFLYLDAVGQSKMSAPAIQLLGCIECTDCIDMVCCYRWHA